MYREFEEFVYNNFDFMRCNSGDCYNAYFFL